jgi:ankyrin repeat protein
MMIRAAPLIVILTFMATQECCTNADFGPAYDWKLFKNSPNWVLVDAVENEHVDEIREIIDLHNINVNLQEPRFGRTLLMLAVGNDKLKSVEALLRANANVNIRDSNDMQAIHEAVSFINQRKHSYDIIKLLIKYGADLNSTSHGRYYVPLAGATQNLACARLLIDNGADIYVKHENGYPVWTSALVSRYSEGIFVIKYLIIDRKKPVPNPIFDYQSFHNPLSIYDLLRKNDFSRWPKKQQAKDQILDYLQHSNFPIQNVYHEKPPK